MVGLVSLRRGCEWTHWGFLNTTEAVVCSGNGNKGEGGEISASLESPDVSLKWSPAKLICSVSPTGFSESQKAVFLKLSPQGDNDLLEFQSLPGAFNFASLLKASTRAGPSNPLHTQPFSFSELLATVNLKRSVCFNSCFDDERLELFLPAQLVLTGCLYLTLLFSNAQLWPTDFFAKQKHKLQEVQEKASYWGHAV